MPIEVRELIIKAVVDSGKESGSRHSNRKKASKKNVADGLEKLLEMVNNKNER